LTSDDLRTEVLKNKESEFLFGYESGVFIAYNPTSKVKIVSLDGVFSECDSRTGPSYAVNLEKYYPWIMSVSKMGAMTSLTLELQGDAKAIVKQLGVQVSVKRDGREVCIFSKTNLGVCDVTFPVIERLGDVIAELSVSEYAISWNCNDFKYEVETPGIVRGYSQARITCNIGLKRLNSQILNSNEK
jgi:hypothetical protein